MGCIHSLEEIRRPLVRNVTVLDNLVLRSRADMMCRLQKMGKASRMAIPAGIRRMSGSGGLSDRDDGSGTVSPTKEAKVSAGWDKCLEGVRYVKAKGCFLSWGYAHRILRSRQCWVRG